MTARVRPEEIDEIIQVFQDGGLAELHIRFDGFELHLGDGSDGAPMPGIIMSAPPTPSTQKPGHEPPPAPITSVVSAVSEAELAGLEIVRAPYLGTFYGAPKPGAPAYIEVGSVVKPDTDVCLIEVMKLFTAVRAGMNGVVVRVLASDGAMVEADQPLFAIRPGD